MIVQSKTPSATYSLRVDLRSDESLLGFLGRSAERMMLPRVEDLIAASAETRVSLSDFHGAGSGEGAVAKACGIELGELQRRRHVKRNAKAFGAAFDGQIIDTRLLNWRHPRVAPSTYRRLGYHRAAWDIQFLSFDTESGEALISGCPRCATPFSWRQTSFFTCTACGRPIDPLDGPLASEEERETAGTFADLLSLNADRRAEARLRLSPELQGLSTEAVYKFLFEVSGLFEATKYTLKNRPSRIDWPTVLTRAYQIATEWPEAFLAVLEAAHRRSSDREGRFGIRKEFGDIADLLRNWNAVPEIRAKVFPVVRRFLAVHPEIPLKAKTSFYEAVRGENALMTLKEVRHAYSWGHEKARRLLDIPGVVVASSQGSGAPMMLNRHRIAEIADDMSTWLSRRAIRNIWKLRHEAVAELCDAGVFPEVIEPYTSLVERAESVHRRKDVERIIERLHECAGELNPSTRLMKFETIVNRIKPFNERPWASVAKAILDGRLRPAKIRAKKVSGVGRIQFLQSDAERFIREHCGIGRQTYSLAETAKLLHIHADTVRMMVRKELLRTEAPMYGEVGTRVTKEEFERFDREFVSSAALAARYGVQGQFVIMTLEAMGIERQSWSLSNRPVYLRKEVPNRLRIMTREEVRLKLAERGITRPRHPWHG
jgi:hypothetical protein